MPIEQRDFSAGWINSDDDLNGRKNGMLQMDNLCLDENGTLTLVRGTKDVSASLGIQIHSLYSRHIGTDFYRYAALRDGSIIRDKNEAGTFGTSVLTGGDLNRAEFTSALDQVFIVNGTKYKKDNGTVINDIGIVAPTAPTTAVFGVPSQIDLQNLDGGSQFTNWSVDQGVLTYNNANNDMRFQTDATSFQAVIRTVFAAPKDLVNYPSGGGWATSGMQLISDVIQFYVSIPDATQLQSVTINLLSFDPGSAPSLGAPSGSYYTKTWNYTDSPAPFSSNLWNLLSAKIEDFTQAGDTSQKYWNSIKAITVTFIAASQIALGFTEINEQGSSRAALSGDYEYYTQNVADTTTYEAVSKVSSASTQIHVENGAVTVTLTPPVDAQSTNVNLFRREINTQGLATIVATLSKATVTYIDGVSDASLLANGDTTANLFFTSIQSITNPILSIIGLYLGRMLYFTASSLYISDFLDPDIYDSRYILKYSGNTAETFLWAKKISNALIYVGTTSDIYQISGTLSALPDGTLDAKIVPLSVTYPPVSQAVAVESGSIIYMANDGWRIYGSYGDDSNNLSKNVELLFKGYARYNTPAVIPGYNNTSPSKCTINRGKFYTIVTFSTGDQGLFVFDIEKQYWYQITRDPLCLFTEEDGTLLIGDSDFKVKELDTPLNYLSSEVTYQRVQILTPIFDGGTPRQRKDCFTLKFKIDTGNVALALSIYQDGVLAQTLNIAGNGPQEIEIDAASFKLGKLYQLSLNGLVPFFKLYFWNIEYTDRPVQVTRLRIPPSNFDSSGKKRMFTCPPFVIDTLGNTVSFVPEIDGVAGSVTNPNITCNDKTTIVPTFSNEVIATDVGGVLSGGLFEFYGVFESDWVVEKIPTGRLVDQGGPYEALRLAFLERFRYRCIAEGSLINYSVYVEDVVLYSSSFVTTPNVDKTYEVVVPKGLNGTTFRIVFTSDSLIHRYSLKVKLRITGGQADGKWVG